MAFEHATNLVIGLSRTCSSAATATEVARTLRVVEDFTGFLGGPPDFADHENLRRYQLHLVVSGASPATT